MIYPLVSIQFLLFFFLFLVSSMVTFYLPGAFIMRSRKLPFPIFILTSFILGIVLWGFQAFIFGYLHLRFLSFGYILLSLFLGYTHRKQLLVDWALLVKEIAQNKLLSIFVVFGVLCQLVPVIGSGLLYPEGVRFFGVNGMDGIMHLAFIRSIVNHFPPQEPGAAGNPLTNYHYWSDMIIADLVRVWHLPTTHVFFQYFPVLVSLLTATASYQVMKALGFSKKAGWWAIFFLFFTGDMAYALIAVTRHTLSFSAPAIDNGVDQFLNMPNALARPIFLTSIISFQYLLEKRSRFWQVITILLFASLVGIKVYYGIFVLFGMGMLTAWLVLKQFFTKAHELSPIHRLRASLQENFFLLGPLVLTSIIAAVIYLPANKGSGGLGWYPLEWPKIFLGSDGVNWGDWFLRQQVYQQAHNYRNMILYDSIAIIITLFCVHGTRLVGLLSGKILYKKSGMDFILFLFPGIILFHFLGLFTLQKAGGFNVFNFFVVSTVVMSLLSAMILERYRLNSYKKIGLYIALLVVLLSIIRPLHQLQNAVMQLENPKTSSVLISRDEIAGLTYIKNHSGKNDIVQSYPTDPLDSQTPSVSFFTDRLTYLTGEGLQRTHNQPISTREKKANELFNAISSPDFTGKARSLGINYVYLKKNSGQKLLFNVDKNLIEKVYENTSVVVYRLHW